MVVDEKLDPFAIKQLVNFYSYLEQKVNTLPDQEQPEESKGITMKLNLSSSNKCMEYTFDPREPFFTTRPTYNVSCCSCLKGWCQRKYYAYLVEETTGEPRYFRS